MRRWQRRGAMPRSWSGIVFQQKKYQTTIYKEVYASVVTQLTTSRIGSSKELAIYPGACLPSHVVVFSCVSSVHPQTLVVANTSTRRHTQPQGEERGFMRYSLQQTITRHSESAFPSGFPLTIGCESGRRKLPLSLSYCFHNHSVQPGGAPESKRKSESFLRKFFDN